MFEGQAGTLQSVTAPYLLGDFKQVAASLDEQAIGPPHACQDLCICSSRSSLSLHEMGQSASGAS